MIKVKLKFTHNIYYGPLFGSYVINMFMPRTIVWLKQKCQDDLTLYTEAVLSMWKDSVGHYRIKAATYYYNFSALDFFGWSERPRAFSMKTYCDTQERRCRFFGWNERPRAFSMKTYCDTQERRCRFFGWNERPRAFSMKTYCDTQERRCTLAL